MNIITTTTQKIHLKRDELKFQFYSAFVDLFKDELNEEDPDYLEQDMNRLTDYMNQINKGNFKDVFADGCTMMILPSDVFDFVDKWFNKPGTAFEKLELHIVDKNGKVEVVDSEYLSY